jgi:signal transduction histidine kinase
VSSARQVPGGPSGEPWGSPAELIAAASHELRQPLASIRGFTEMLLGHWGEFSDADKKEMLRAVLHEAVRLGHLVDELRDLSKLQLGRVPLGKSPVDLPALARRVVLDLKAAYPELEAVIEFPENFPVVIADAFKIEQVMANIIENSCKYGSPATVRIAGSVGEHTVEVSVCDKGPGILPEELPHVTEKFFRRPGGGQADGLGLGLWIARGIVEAHGGQLVPSSAPGSGATITFSLPRAKDERAGQ